MHLKDTVYVLYIAILYRSHVSSVQNILFVLFLLYDPPPRCRLVAQFIECVCLYFTVFTKLKIKYIAVCKYINSAFLHTRSILNNEFKS